jgi:hypothetical protein
VAPTGNTHDASFLLAIPIEAVALPPEPAVPPVAPWRGRWPGRHTGHFREPFDNPAGLHVDTVNRAVLPYRSFVRACPDSSSGGRTHGWADLR